LQVKAFSGAIRVVRLAHNGAQGATARSEGLRRASARRTLPGCRQRGKTRVRCGQTRYARARLPGHYNP